MVINTAVWTAGFIAVAMMGWFSLITVWARRDSALRPFFVLAFCLSIPLTVALTTEFLGWHKPYNLAWRLEGRDMWVMKVVMRPGKGIFLYVDDEREPRSISLPWDPDLADKIQKALETSKKNGAEGMLMTFSPSLKQEELIHLNPRALGLAPKEPIVLPEYLRE